ncbi:MAG: hypothetical protein H6696_18390 [Deferribacteres bacterium]|nr:hypothetical protein [candidate division KSB1 bacterium]MCB9503897.1 hypothetical protein [Deferribacteres bacterium]
MKINQSNLQLNSTYNYQHQIIQQETLEINKTPIADKQKEIPHDRHEVNSTNQSEQNEYADPFGIFHRMRNLKFMLVKMFIERMTGKEIDLLDPKSFEEKPKDETQETAATNQEEVGFGLHYTATTREYESENMQFSMQAQIETADGEKVQIDLQFSMSREFMRENAFEFQAGSQLTDPMVAHYNGTAAELRSQRFEFDINSDGINEFIPFASAGSGFLAVDKNGDGRINDGSELFGATSGDGFAELSIYDDDQNGWIDENDAVFSDLRVWSKNAAGEDYLRSLRELGIGAIALDSVATPFTLKDAQNNVQAQVRRTGFFLREDFSAGVVQQIDLAV